MHEDARIRHPLRPSHTTVARMTRQDVLQARGGRAEAGRGEGETTSGSGNEDR